MLLDFPFIQLFRSVISKLFQQGFFELIIVEPIIWRRCHCTIVSSTSSPRNPSLRMQIKTYNLHLTHQQFIFLNLQICVLV